MADPIHAVCPSCGGVNRVPVERLGQAPRCGRCHESLFQGRPLELDALGFSRQVERSDLPVLVDFWAAWCGPCRIMAPVLEEAARALEPRLRIAKVNTEQEQGLALQLGIRSIPTLVLFKGGREAARVSGALDAHSLRSWLDTHL